MPRSRDSSTALPWYPNTGRSFRIALVRSSISHKFVASTDAQTADPTRFTIYQEVSKSDNSAIVFSATYKFSYPAGHSSGFPLPLDTLSSSNTRSDMNSLISAASMEHTQFHGDRYPLYVAPEWSPSLRSRENSPTQGYRSPSSDSSTCFPSDLSNYVSVGNFCSTTATLISPISQVL